MITHIHTHGTNIHLCVKYEASRKSGVVASGMKMEKTDVAGKMTINSE